MIAHGTAQTVHDHPGILTTRTVQHRPTVKRTGLDWGEPTRDPDAIARLVANGTLVVVEDRPEQPAVVERRRTRRPRRHGGGAHRKLTEQQIAAAAEEWEAGIVPQRTIAAKYGASVETLRRAVRLYGVPPRRANNIATARAGQGRLLDLMAANGITSAQVRDWAGCNGRECSPLGLPPRQVVEEFLLARTGAERG